ncbi:tetra-peptide repeat homeobox protein 1-like [Macrobrachium rosenbergii]|uniref:tetra-peptide repeat homeobox protein 1-like n=1 Tax=Macrobrachium rosenbergii TaxID=79674 RepID=UPI0034D5F14B
MSKSHKPAFIPLPVPPEYNVQQTAPSEQISKSIPVPGPAPVPVPRTPIDLPPGDPKIGSQSLPVPLECTEQCQALSIPNGRESPNPMPVPDPALVPVPAHAPDLHSRDPRPGPLSSPGLAPIPVPLRERYSSNHSGSSPKGVASQPLTELVIATCEHSTPTRTSSSFFSSPQQA